MGSFEFGYPAKYSQYQSVNLACNHIDKTNQSKTRQKFDFKFKIVPFAAIYECIVAAIAELSRSEAAKSIASGASNVETNRIWLMFHLFMGV